MPIANVNGIDLAYDEYGDGFPLIWVHEFAGSMESWLPQVNFFSRRYRVIVYNARGYPPSSVPADAAAYSQDHAVEDLYGLLKHLGIERAHVGGLSMGGSCALHFGIRHPETARSLIIAAAGSGSDDPEDFRRTCRALADQLDREGPAGVADYGSGATRLQLKRKDPQGYKVFLDLLRRHSAIGSALRDAPSATARPRTPRRWRIRSSSPSRGGMGFIRRRSASNGRFSAGRRRSLSR
jgi:pimeloyl-ACP methyl ester carboxylesterase